MTEINLMPFKFQLLFRKAIYSALHLFAVALPHFFFFFLIYLYQNTNCVVFPAYSAHSLAKYLHESAGLARTCISECCSKELPVLYMITFKNRTAFSVM